MGPCFWRPTTEISTNLWYTRRRDFAFAKNVVDCSGNAHPAAPTSTLSPNPKPLIKPESPEPEPLDLPTSQGESGWIEASGPVVVDPEHPDYKGAHVEANNTGKLTPIIKGYAVCSPTLMA